MCTCIGFVQKQQQSTNMGQQQSTNMEQEQDQQTLFNLMQQGQGEMHCTQQSSTSNQPFQAKKITPRRKK